MKYIVEVTDKGSGWWSASVKKTVPEHLEEVAIFDGYESPDEALDAAMKVVLPKTVRVECPAPGSWIIEVLRHG